MGHKLTEHDGVEVEPETQKWCQRFGFWAYGEFRDGVLDHAGYRLIRR